MLKTALNEDISSIGSGRPLTDSAGSSRIAIYSQDGLGLGHLRRNIQICKEFLKQTPEGKGQVLLIALWPPALSVSALVLSLRSVVLSAQSTPFLCWSNQAMMFRILAI